ncbi:retrovirus-related pol polyprotein from transposon TNT 1-94 [Tanacetum coccineum]|uniref:Retrovirus-related pol polyprotein from transposon TNT 1-94 n=1 Tax=Tanacetum coccineum TaxID=301880 RepID=A0ABQ5HFN6_9ASTR
MLNELSNDGVNLSKYEINVGFVNSLLEKWLTSSQGLRNANHTQTLDLTDIYERFVYEDNLIQKRYSKTKKALITTPSMSGFSSKGFQPKFTPKLIQFSQSPSSQAKPKIQKDYKAEYKKMKVKLALLEANKEEVSDDEEVTEVKVLMALADTELTIGKNHARNGEWIDITMRKNNSKRRKRSLKWLTNSKKVSQCISEQIPHQKKKVLGGELFTESLSKINVNENLFIPASIDYDHEMIPKSKDWVERLNPDCKLLNFKTRRILVPKSQVVNETLKPTEGLTDPKSSKYSEAESITPLPPLKNLHEALPSLESVSGTVTVSETEPTTPLVPTEVKNTKQELKINEVTKLVQMLIDEKILKAKAKPFPPCTYYGFNDHRPYDCKNYTECEIYRSYDHFTSGHNHVIHVRGVLVECFQFSESSIGVKCNTCGSTVHSTTDHNESDHFKRGVSQNFSSPYTLEQNGIAKRNNKTLIEATRTMLNGSILPKHFWTEAFRIARFFKVFNIRRQQVEETYHVTFDESIEAIRFTNTLVNEIGINDSSRYPLDEFLHEDDPSRQYQANSDILYYVIPHGRSLTELTQENHVPEVIAPNEPDTSHTEDVEGSPV